MRLEDCEEFTRENVENWGDVQWDTIREVEIKWKDTIRWEERRSNKVRDEKIEMKWCEEIKWDNP